MSALRIDLRFKLYQLDSYVTWNYKCDKRLHKREKMPVIIQHLPLGIMAITSMILASCASTYKAPSDPALSASVDVYKGYKTGVGFGKGTQQEYSVYTSDQCDTPQRLASFTWTNGEMKNKTVAANEPLRVGAFTNYFSTGSGGYWNGSAYIVGTDVARCPSFAKFTPQAGAKYKIIQTEADDRSCSLEITNIATSKAPQDLVIGQENTCIDLGLNADS